jgi:8-oxo-dGTP pyrophosphatase MutT (NUDIX family)
MKHVVPRLSASLLIVDDTDKEPRFLFGRRHARHVFMPNRYVFPGGRVDKYDAKVPVTLEMHPSDRFVVGSHLNNRHKNKGAEALAFCAIREAWEESGQLFGKCGAFEMDHEDWRVFIENALVPNLSALRLLARAVTPATLPRRYDTWFFMGFRSSIALTADVCGPDSELDHQVWASEAESRAFDLPAITRMVLREAVERLKTDPDLSRSPAVPKFLTRGGTHMRRMMTA